MSKRKMIWSPSILTNLVDAYLKDMTAEEIWQYIITNAKKDDVEYFVSHFKRKSTRKGVNCKDQIIKRIKNEVSSAKQIIPLGNDALNEWINNIGSARTYAWRRQKRNEMLNDKNK